MDNALQQLCKDRKYCIEEMARIREMWSYKKTFTPKNIEGAWYSLHAMLLYAPIELHEPLTSMRGELAMRESSLILSANWHPVEEEGENESIA